MSEQVIKTTLDLQADYKFLVTFDEPGVPPLLMDEPEPLGGNAGPNASRVLSAAVGNCLSASALHCLKKAHIDVRGIHTEVETQMTRNPQGRMRISDIKVRIAIDVPDEQRPRISRCMELFEDFCLVTQSVRNGVSVDVRVDDSPMLR